MSKRRDKMNELKLKNVNMVLVDHRTQVRTGLRMALNEAGLSNSNIIDGPDSGTVLEALQLSNPPDILICDAASQGADLVKTFHAIRHNEIGQNPFVAMIAVTWDPTAVTINRVANSGADFILAAPFSPQQLLDRITSLVHHRVPFIVTSDYIGPDRRYKSRTNSTIPLIEVPNSLREKAMGSFNAKQFRLRVDNAVGGINGQKMERHAVALAVHAEVLVGQFEHDRKAVDSDRLGRLRAAANDLKWRARDAGLLPIIELCEALYSVVGRIIARRDKDLAKEFELMKQLSFAIRQSFAVSERDAVLVHDVAHAVSSRG
jgi:DNA-binding response OmpR family regulator